jgi:hypothetical protein
MRITQSLILLALCTSSFSANASEADVIEALKDEISALTARLERLEANTRKVETQLLSAPTASTAAAPATQSNWADTSKLKGDFRYRHESFDVDGQRDRHRHRMRARVGITSQVNDTVEVGFQLATGSDDPLSTNQTLGDASSSKNVVVDLAYAKWTTPVDGLTVSAGKFKNPLYRAGDNGLIWDSDLNPEGVGASWESGQLFANALGSWIEESSSDDDSFLIGGQFGISQPLGDNDKLVAGVGYYHYLNARGEPVFFDGNPKGNRLRPDGTYLNGFELVEAFAEYSFGFYDNQVTVFGDYVQNLDASNYDTGFALGAKLKQANGLQYGWTYQELEADAVLGTFTDSNFIGGSTDGEGHILFTTYPVSKNISLKGTLFLNDRMVDFGNEQEYKRFMLDIRFKY